MQFIVLNRNLDNQNIIDCCIVNKNKEAFEFVFEYIERSSVIISNGFRFNYIINIDNNSNINSDNNCYLEVNSNNNLNIDVINGLGFYSIDKRLRYMRSKRKYFKHSYFFNNTNKFKKHIEIDIKNCLKRNDFYNLECECVLTNENNFIKKENFEKIINYNKNANNKISNLSNLY